MATKFHQFIYNAEAEVESDHKPLESIMLKPLHQVSPRMQMMLLKLLKYNLTVKYVPGSKLYIANTLSWAYTQDTNDEALSPSSRRASTAYTLLLSTCPPRQSVWTSCARLPQMIPFSNVCDPLCRMDGQSIGLHLHRNSLPTGRWGVKFMKRVVSCLRVKSCWYRWAWGWFAHEATRGPCGCREV